ncbi:ABC transporter ATP-binding protein [Liquorilactobacillus satsumensis]|uniref:ABC transporter ATP-binding protein n=1 Tax=Liquorilactobacillus satsumensis TaxID=259059 RepID=UPI0021C3842A|nr:ABC transporter ATP-binding protein [Liquorilactobacillus satsumensis]MCP9313089.1 ABC transporter ATP-binding protein [Liquorilactobacillus satsumensis]MCP9360245.1 ABC transporter ATP-binding protein [Liquorilactobacillus satsumensis]
MPQHGPARNIGKTVDKPKNFWQTAWRLCKYMAPWKWFLALVFIFAIGSVIFQIISPKVLGEATTEIFNGVVKYQRLQPAKRTGALPIDFDKIKVILLTVGGMYLVSALLGFFQQLIMANISQKIVFKLRADLKDKMQRLPINYYDTHSNGDIMSRAVNDMDNIAGTLQQSLAQMVTSIVTFVGVLIMMFTISWQLTLIACITVPLGILVVALIAPRSQKYFAKQQQSLGSLNDQVEENFAGHTVVKTFNKEEESLEKFNEQNELYYKSSWKAQFISGLIMPVMNFVKNLGYVFVAVVGGIKVAHGNLSLGDVQAFLQYVNQFTQPITQIANIANTIQATVASAERIFQVLDEEEMQKTHVAIPDKAETEYKIEFEDAAFGYDSKQPVLKNLNLAVTTGEKIAIVGPTGAGKTTLVNLLERFYDIQGGTLRLAGRDTRNLSREAVRSHFAMVLQDTWLFTGTIYDNIKYGRETAREKEVLQAAKAAHADSFIRQLPQGYQTILNEEASNISQGQRQLLTIARAFLADPEILILDEATSSVDTRTEILIQKAMAKLLKGRTSFIVAHRLSTIRDADKIIVMNHGAIIEAGNHAALLAKKGFYADLYNSQFTTSA